MSSFARISPTARRWLTVVIYAVVAWIAWIGIEPFAAEWLRALWQPYLDLAGAWAYPLAVVAAALLAWARNRSGWTGVTGILYWRGYPPVWVAVFLALLLRVLQVTVQESKTHAIAGVGATLVAGLVLWSALAWLARMGSLADAAAETPRDPRELASLPDSDDALRDWLSRDDAISASSDDRFDFSVAVERIARRFEDDACSDPSTAIVGPIGSGKSSLCQLLEKRLTRDKRRLVVRISVWPYHTAEAAARAVLDASLERVAKEVPVLAVSGLSDDWVEVVDSAAPGVRGILRRLRRSQNPASILRGLDDLLGAARLHLLIIIEDLERFEPEPRGAAGSGATTSRALSEVQALLYHLDQRTRISVIVANASLQYRFDHTKTSRYIERIEPIRPLIAWKIVERVRRSWLSSQCIDPATSKYRDQFNSPVDPDESRIWTWKMTNVDLMNLPGAVGVLLETPRVLKQALRYVEDARRTILGEVDSDGVVAASAIRAARPDVFDLLQDEIETFRIGNGTDVRSSQELSRRTAVFVRFEESLRDCRSALQRRALSMLVGYLFPDFSSEESQRQATLHSAGDHPQALSVADGVVDYWRRYVTLTLDVAPSRSDQRTLTRIRDCARDASALRGLMSDEAGVAAARRFSRRFIDRDGTLVARLFCEVCDQLTSRRVIDRNGELLAPELDVVTSVASMPDLNTGLLADELAGSMDRLVPRNLALVLALVKAFIDNAAEPILTEAERKRAHDALRQALDNAFCGATGPATLHSALSQAPSPVLFELASRAASDTAAFPQSNELSGSLAAALINLAECNPAAGVPPLLWFVTRYRTLASTAGSDAVFDETRARGLFDLNRLAEVLNGANEPAEADEQIRDRLRVAREWARNYRSSP